MRILLVEDHEPLGFAVQEHLLSERHVVDWVRSLAEARSCVTLIHYDLILLDMLLPDGRGMTLLSELRRRKGRGAVIIVTALDRIADRIDGLNAGADDYLVKPFDLDELSARVLAVARRCAERPERRARIGELTVDLDARSLWRGERTVDLTVREWALFEALVRASGSALSKERLEALVYPLDDELGSNVIEAHVSRLRKKIGRDAVLTVHGVGYRLPRPLDTQDGA